MDLALLLVRLIGLGFAAHGAQKLFGWFGGYGLAGTGGYFESIGFKPGRVFAAAAGASEIAGGLLLALGLFAPVASMLIVSVMVVAMLTVHAGKGFFAQNGGAELPVAYIAIAVAIALVGPGSYSLDSLLGIGGIWTPAASWAALGLGVVGGLGNVALRRKDAPAQQPAGS
ncbi:MAG: DoxX family protein [Vulcanimicrobiaceae bacterium]